MSRRTDAKPIASRPTVQLPARRRGTLIGRASRTLILAGKREAAAMLRERLLAAVAAEHVAILAEFVAFWPEIAVSLMPIGDVRRHWWSRGR